VNSHTVTMLGTGLIGDFYTATLHGQRSRYRVEVVYSRSEGRGQAFKERVNTLERDEEFQKQNGTDDGWFLKSKVRDRGCLISDSWEGGTAAELVDRGTIAIYPIGGWWKTLKDRRLAGREARFSLCVSLDVHDAQIDIYTPIQLAVENLVGVTADSGAAQV